MSRADERHHDDPDHARSSLELEQEARDVWEALTDPARLAGWMGDGSTIDPRPGGAISVADPVGGRPRRGRVVEIEPQRALELDWWPADEPEQVTRVRFTLEPADQRTILTVTETVPPALTSSARASAAVSAVSAHLVAAQTWRLSLLAVALSIVPDAGVR